MYGTTSSSRRPHDPGDNHSDSSNSSADFMAHPFQAFRPSLFVSLQSPDGEPSPDNNTTNAPQNDTLPSLHDQSWIGARMSPIDKAMDDDHGQSQHPPPPFLSLNQQHAPSAGHQRQEYPAFGIHPLQATAPLKSPAHKFANRQAWRTTWGSWGAVLVPIAGFFLLGMGILDAYVGRIDGFAGDRAWSLPWGQPSLEASTVGGGLIPNLVLQVDTDDDHAFRRSYWRFLSSGLQCNSVVEWLLIMLGWFVCARPSIYTLSTPMVGTIYTICTLTGQSWMLAVWWLTQQPGNSKADILVAHCAAWGTCGVLCFVGMLRPKRRLGCFLICIGLVVLSLLQALWCMNASEQVRNPLPLVAGCTASAFVGWLLYGSQIIIGGKTDLSVLRRVDQLPSVRLSIMPARRKPQIHAGVKIVCTILVMTLWMVPPLVLAYFDHFYFLHGDT